MTRHDVGPMTAEILAEFIVDRVTWADVAQSLEERLAQVTAERDRIRAAAEAIIDDYAECVDGEWGCCHDAASLRRGGRLPDYPGDEFQPLPDSCSGKEILTASLARLDAPLEAS